LGVAFQSDDGFVAVMHREEQRGLRTRVEDCSIFTEIASSFVMLE
jgi:hypothetical protein